jgi:hypothetical protein
VGERRLRRWLTENHEFKAEYEPARSAMFQAGMSRIQALAAWHRLGTTPKSPAWNSPGLPS